MKYAIILISLLVIGIACGNESINTNTDVADNEKTEKAKIISSTSVRDTFDCKVFGKRDKTSDRWLSENEMYFAMTNDIFQDEQPKFTAYHVFQVYNTLNCNLIYNGKLPLVKDLERPYKLQADIYEPINQLVCTQSPENIYCYHVGRKEVLIPLSPPIAMSKVGTYDPSLGRDLTTFGNNLFGWTEKIGVYAFDMTNLHNPAKVMQVGTYSTATNTNYLFLLNTSDGMQLLISEITDGDLTMHPVIKEPMNLNRRVYRDKSGGRYAFFKLNVGNDYVAIDLAERKMISLPNKVKGSTLDVKNYLQTL